MTETIDKKFEDSSKLTWNEIKALQELSENPDKLDKIDKKTLADLKTKLEAEKKWYDDRSKNEKAKEWIDWMIDKIIWKIDTILNAVQTTTQEKTKTEPTEQAKVETQGQNLAPKVKPAPETQGQNLAPEQTETAEHAEGKFDTKLEKLLDPKTTLIFKVGNDAMVMSFDNEAKKKNAETFLSNLETSFQNDKEAAYALIKFLKDNKDNIKTVSDIYKEAWKWLHGNQLVHAENSWQKELALLDAAKKNDVKVIEADKWNSFLNAVWNTLTLSLYHVDTASVWQETLDNGDYGKKMTSKDLLNWYTKEVKDWKNGKKTEVVQEPLWHFEKSEVIWKIADKMEDIFADDNLAHHYDDYNNATATDKNSKKYDDIDKTVAKLLLPYQKYLQDESNKHIHTADSDIKKFQDKTIKKWLNSDEAKKILKDIIPEKDSDTIEVTKDGFMHIDEGKLKETKYVNVKLDKAWDKWEDKEVLMKVNQLKFTDLGLPTGVDFSNIPPMVLKDGTMCSFGKEWVYVMGEKIGDWADAVKDYIKDHQTVAAALAWWIIWALLVKWIKIPDIDVSFLKDLWKPFEKLWQAIKKWVENLKINLPDLNNIFGWYLLTALPMNYKIDLLETKIAKLKGNYEWSKAMDAEIDAITGKELGVSMKDSLKYDEASNKLAHYALVKDGIFNPWETTWLVFEKAQKDGDNYVIKAISWHIVVGDHTFTLSDWDSFNLIVDKEGEVQSIKWNLTEEVTWKDNKITIDGFKNVEYTIWHTFWKDEKKTTSFDELRVKDDKKTQETKQETKKVDDKQDKQDKQDDNWHSAAYEKATNITG